MKRISPFCTSYFLSVGVSNLLLLLLSILFRKTETLLTPSFLLAMDTSLLINLGIYYPICLPHSASPLRYWCRRFIWLCIICILTPSVFIRFGCVSPEKQFFYFIAASLLILLLGTVSFWIADRVVTRINIEKINNQLSK